MKLTKGLILALFISTLLPMAASAKSFMNVPVQIVLDKDKQADTVGFNLVESLPDLIYKYILANRVTLWTTPAKEVAIKPGALIALEASNQVSFSNTKKLVINQMWSNNKKRSNFMMVGFSFVSQNSLGNALSLGFVDAQEVYQLLNSILIPVNINGTYKCSYWDAVLSMRYQYDIIQFGKKSIRTHYEELQKIKQETFLAGKPCENMVYLPNRKKISYYILPDYNGKITDSEYLFKGLRKFLNQNLEVFFNMGGNAMISHLAKNINLDITGIKLTEVWSKERGNMSSIPLNITLYINDKPLPEMDIDDLSKFELLFNFKTLKQLLYEKNFDFFITEINDYEIKLKDTDKYYKALRIYSWTQLTEAVKYY